jgi:TonB family protein
MRGYYRSCAFAGVVFLVPIPSNAGNPAQEVKQQASSRTTEVGVGPSNLQALVISRVMPKYPPESLGKKIQGVVVTQVYVGPTGRIDRFEVLQAPDPEMSRAVGEALGQWVFKPTGAPDGSPAVVRSKVMIYFAIRNGKGLVLTASEMAKLRLGEEKAPGSRVPQSYPTITSDEWLRLAKSGRAVLIDIRHREAFVKGHFAGAVNLPENELSVRAPAELPKDSPVVVDCPPSAAELCPYALRILQRSGFQNVSVLKRN